MIFNQSEIENRRAAIGGEGGARLRRAFQCAKLWARVARRGLARPAIAFCLVMVPLLAFTAEPAASGEPKKVTGLPVASLQRETPVEFEQELLPVLKNNCLACHN